MICWELSEKEFGPGRKEKSVEGGGYEYFGV